MSKIYTKTGDQGQTSLVGGSRVSKDDLRIAAAGTIDELNAVLGMVRVGLSRLSTGAAAEDLDAIDRLAATIQHQLFDLGAEIASVDPAAYGTQLLADADILQLEAAIDQFDRQLPPLKAFILPGGSQVAAEFHLARSVCRRAERLLVTLASNSSLRSDVLCYVNRLSDLLFVLARSANQACGVSDVIWQAGGRGRSERTPDA